MNNKWKQIRKKIRINGWLHKNVLISLIRTFFSTTFNNSNFLADEPRKVPSKDLPTGTPAFFLYWICSWEWSSEQVQIREQSINRKKNISRLLKISNPNKSFYCESEEEKKKQLAKSKSSSNVVVALILSHTYVQYSYIL